MERTNNPNPTEKAGDTPTKNEIFMIKAPQHPSNDYWKIRESYLEQLKSDYKLKKENRKRILIYIFRKLLWSFGFFPVFLAVWIPLLLSHFNLVVFFQQLETLITSFLAQTPNLQAATTESIIIGWASIGCMFMVFDLVLTPYRSPFEEQADAYMKARYMMFGIHQKDTSSPEQRMQSKASKSSKKPKEHEQTTVTANDEAASTENQMASTAQTDTIEPVESSIEKTPQPNDQ